MIVLTIDYIEQSKWHGAKITAVGRLQIKNRVNKHEAAPRINVYESIRDMKDQVSQDYAEIQSRNSLFTADQANDYYGVDNVTDVSHIFKATSLRMLV